MENLKAVDADEGGYASKVANEVNSNEILIDEMEHSRRKEEAFRQQHEREQRAFAGDNIRAGRPDD